MSEYWVSRKKYFCQYCEIFIADDAPSRSQHENGLRHKGNKDRFVRGLYKAGIKEKQDREEEKREMKRVEEAARAAFAHDISTGRATSGASSSSAVPVSSSKPKPAPPKPSDPYANYTTAAQLGFTDPDVERLVAEAKAKKSEGRVGDWVAVESSPPPPPPETHDTTAEGDVKVEPPPPPSTGEVRKRADGPVDDGDTRHFKLRKKTAPVGLGEIYDPGIIKIKPRVVKQAEAEETETTIKREETGLGSVPAPILGSDVHRHGDGENHEGKSGPRTAGKLMWTTREWKRAGDDKVSHVDHDSAFRSEKPPDLPTTVKEDVDAVVKTEEGNNEPQAASGGSLFKKRHISRSTSARGRRQP